MRVALTTLLSCFFIVTISAQSISKSLYQTYDVYKEKTFKVKRFKHSDIVPLIKKVKMNKDFQVDVIGQSFEKRDIYQIKYGNGPINVLLWSQMHGNEATATMALFDIFNFLSKSGDEYDDYRKQIATSVTLIFVPMLNPDGAQKWQRRTAQEIDMNRDALRLVCPESVILKSLVDKYTPLVGYNLHDQDHRVSAGNTNNLATLSFLASAYDHALTINDVRFRSMQLIAYMDNELQSFIPNQIARYSDDHEPRAFGDNIQKWGTSLILIESGGYKNDPEKMQIRKLNYVAMLSSFLAIANEEYTRFSTPDYEKIPKNRNFHFDLLIRNATIHIGNRKYKSDIGINRNEVTSKNFLTYTYKSVVSDMGDLSTYHGIDEMDAEDGYILDILGKSLSLKIGMPATFNISQKNNKKVKVDNGFLK